MIIITKSYKKGIYVTEVRHFKRKFIRYYLYMLLMIIKGVEIQVIEEGE